MKKAIILSEKEFNSIPFLLQPKILKFWDNLLKEDPNFNPYRMLGGGGEILLAHLCLSFFEIEKEMKKNNLFSLEKEAEEILKQKAIWYDLNKEIEEISKPDASQTIGILTILCNLKRKQDNIRNKIDKIEEEAIERIGAKIKKIKMLKSNMKTMNKLTQNKEKIVAERCKHELNYGVASGQGAICKKCLKQFTNEQVKKIKGGK